MRVLSLVTLVTPTGEYGGPVRVALNQARALRERGHEVTLLGAHRGFDGPPPREIEGVPVALRPAVRFVPRTGFAGLAAPLLQRDLHTLARDADVVHVHAARDLVTLPAASWLRRHKVRYVLQTHGMIDSSGRALAKPLDAALTRPVLHGASRVFHLTRREARDLEVVARGRLPLVELPNGVPPAPPRSAAGEVPEVLYLARLVDRKRPSAFVKMADRLSASQPGTRFRLVGPDGGEGPEVARQIAALDSTADVRWEGPLAPELTGERMARSSVYVLPAVDEPYPMSILEAMATGIPVVLTESCGLAKVVQQSGAGLVVPGSVDSLVAAVGRLLRDPALAAAMGEAGRRFTREHLSMDSIAARLEQEYVG